MTDRQLTVAASGERRAVCAHRGHPCTLVSSVSGRSMADPVPVEYGEVVSIYAAPLCWPFGSSKPRGRIPHLCS